jgi:drug/metabolite transporter (DMT)-like permease
MSRYFLSLFRPVIRSRPAATGAGPSASGLVEPARRDSINGVDKGLSGILQIGVAGLLWGTAGVVVQWLSAVTDLNAVGIGFYRLAVAAVVLLVIRRPSVVGVAIRAAPVGLLLTGVGLAAYQVLYFAAVTLCGVSVATVVSLGLAPVLIVGWEAMTVRARPTRRAVGTLGAGVAGLLLVAGPSTGATGPHPTLGLLAAIGCGCCYAATMLLSRLESQRVDAMTLTTVCTGIGALALAPPALLGGFAGLTVPLQVVPLTLLAFLGVVVTAMAYGLFYSGLRTTDGSTAALLTLLEPLTAAVLAVLLLGETWSGPAVVGGTLLLAAIGVRYLKPAGASG